MNRALISDPYGTLIYDDPEIGERRNQLRLHSSRDVLATFGYAYELSGHRGGVPRAGRTLQHGSE